MFLYKIIGGIIVFAALLVVDLATWGTPWLSFGFVGVFVLSFHWVQKLFISGFTDAPPDRNSERTVAVLDRRMHRLRFWWKRRLVGVKRALRTLFGISTAAASDTRRGRR